MPRTSSNNSSTSVQRPALPFKITGTMNGGENFEFPCSKTTASKTARDYMKMGFQNVEIWEHDGQNWSVNTDMTNAARTALQGSGNQKGVMSLQLLQEYTSVLIKSTSKAHKTEEQINAFNAEIRAWVEQFGRTCIALQVNPAIINEILNAAFTAAYAPTEA